MGFCGLALRKAYENNRTSIMLKLFARASPGYFKNIPVSFTHLLRCASNDLATYASARVLIHTFACPSRHTCKHAYFKRTHPSSRTCLQDIHVIRLRETLYQVFFLRSLARRLNIIYTYISTQCVF